MLTKQSPLIFRLAAAFFVLFSTIYILASLQDFFVPLLFSGILTILLLPINAFLERRGISRILAIILTIILAIGALVGISYLIVWQVIHLETLIPQIITKTEQWFTEIQRFIAQRFKINAKDQIAEGQKYLINTLKGSSAFFASALSGMTGLLANFTLLPLYIFLMLLYRDFFLVFLYKLFHHVSNPRIDVVVAKVKDIILNYMVGLLLVILIVGSLNTLSLWLLGIENALFFGFLAGALVLVPYIGIAIGSLLPILVALITKDSYLYAVGVAASFTVIQFLEGNFITPFIVGSKVSINSLIAIISLILFGQLWGLAGLVLALPLTAILKVIFDSVEALKPWGFLLGDTNHQDVARIKSTHTK
ncbi:MAG: AI-2E family transporter [Spirosomataceae bacterium]